MARTTSLPSSLLANPASVIKSPGNRLRELLQPPVGNGQVFELSPGIDPLDYIDQVFEQYNFTYQTTARDRLNIPALGRVVIIANQSTSALHTLALLRQVTEIRRDVKLVIHEPSNAFEPLAPLLIAHSNQSAGTPKQQIHNAIEAEQAVIIFPAGNYNRPRAAANARWSPEFLPICRKSQSPLLPVLIQPQQRLLNFSKNLMRKPLSPFMASARGIQPSEVKLRIGELIAAEALEASQVTDRALVKRIKKHIFKLARSSKSRFETVKTIAHPEDRARLQQELMQAQLLGQTRDQNGIYLTNYEASSLMREVGRMREYSFRKVGEGTGARRDIDQYDQDYDHLILWNQQRLELAGGYRLGLAHALIEKHGLAGLYTHSLFNFSEALNRYLPESVELGRSFVSPQYWGKNSLDYLWQGIGAYIKHNPQVRYVFGPVSISARFPRQLTEELVFYYEHYFVHEQTLAQGKNPFLLTTKRQQELTEKYQGLDQDAGFKLMQEEFTQLGYKMPVLFKQYSGLYEPGGFKLLGFNIDPDFADCIDGLFMADLTKLKPAKRKRYLGE